MKVNFKISGYILDDNEKGLKCMLMIFGQDAYFFSEENGYFILNLETCPFFEILFKKHLSISVKAGEKEYQGMMGYDFRIRPNKHIKLKIYPFSNRVVEVNE